MSGRDGADHRADDGAGDDAGARRGRILEAITRLQSAVIAGESDLRSGFARALDVLLEATGSQYGFIAETCADADATPYLSTLAITDIAWDATSRELAALARRQGLEFRNLDTLFGAPVKTGDTMIANDAPNDPRAGGLPPGHPDVNAFLGLPLRYGGEMIGLAGLANRAGGYAPSLVDELEPLAAALAAMVVAERAKMERDRQTERAEHALTGSDAAVWDWDISSDSLWWSDSLKALLGLPQSTKADFELFRSHIHDDDRGAVIAAVEAALAGREPYHSVFRFKRGDGGYATIRASGQVIRDADGAPQRMVGVQIDISREIEREARLREASEFSGVALAAAGLAAWRWDAATGLITMDARFAALLEQPELEGVPLSRKTVLGAVHPDDRALVEREMDAVLENRTHTFRADHRLRVPSGRTVWVRAHAGVREHTRGGAPVIIGVVVDRTEAKQTELALAEAKERYELAVNGSGMAVWDWNIETDELVWSDALFSILGFKADDVQRRGSFFKDRVHLEDQARVQAALTAHIETGAKYDLKFRMRHRSGLWVPVQSRGASVRDASGRAVRMAGSILDLTAEQNAERTAAEATAKISLAARHAGIGPVELDLVTRTLRGDENFARLIGEPDRREISFDHAMGLVHKDDRIALEARQRALMKSGADRFDAEFRMVRPDGSTVWAEMVAVVTRRDERGDPTLMSGVMIDHTARKQVERDLARANERYDLAVGASHMAIWDQNLVTGEIYWSARMGEILGLGLKEGHEDVAAFTARIHADDKDQTARAFRALVEDGVPYDQITRLRRADGGYATVRSRGGVLRDDGGAPVRVCGSLSDISGEVMAGARADLALEAARLGIWDWDIAGGVMTADSRFAEILGRPWLAGLAAQQTDTLRYIHKDDRAMSEAKVRDLESGRIDRVEFEHRVVRPDGGIVWVGGCASVVETGSDGRPRRVLGVFEDHTARKTAELELAEANQRYDLAVSGALTAIWDQNLETGELYWSAPLGDMIGLGAAERVEQLEDFLERVHPDDREPSLAETRTAIETGAPLDMVMRVRHADGGYRHLRSRAGVLRNPTGRPVRLCGSVTDVTEEIAAEAKARLAGQRAQLALEAAHLGVWEYDAVSGLVSIDHTLADLLGAPDLAGRPRPFADIKTFAHHEDAARVNADIAKLHKGERSTVRNEHRIVRPDGASVWVRADVGVAERAPDGSVLRMIGIVQDLSGVKATEALLRKSAEAAGKANEAKSQFLATMSHEIRTPLNGVLGVVQLLERTELDPRQQRYVKTIKASGRSLSDVIEDVLDISRIEAGKLALKAEPALVADILEQAAAPSRALAAEKQVGLSLTISGDLALPVRVDPRRVAQMTANLIGNAVKFTESGGVRVTATRPSRGVLRIEVDDDGPGLPEDMHEAVFERFTQADMSASRTHQGTGLGLAIVRDLAKLAGGVAGVRSQPGQGACFWIELPAPAIPSTAACQAGPSASMSGETTPDPDAPALRVLVVEDHPVNRAVTAELVTQAGHVCETAETGEEALTALRTGPVDVVLMDLHMPGMDGTETLARIRGGEAGASDLPVYIVSADATPEAFEETKALGASGFFVKPIDAENLRRSLAGLARRSREAS
ncbi:MAG: PAS domain-containing protein [Oceanicaulis sp.]